MTYSIVAIDKKTGELGVGVASHFLAVGHAVPWITGGVGAVATQAMANVAFGPRILALLGSGLDATNALSAALAGDDRPEIRQVAVVDARGRVAVHTGSRCIPFASHLSRDGYSVQANMMLNATVPGAMAKAYESASGDLPERIFTAMVAAEGEGGDIRGRQSAALLVRTPDPIGTVYPWDLRVDDDPEPLPKLKQLMNGRRARGLLADPRINDSIEAARNAFRDANRIAPSDERTFWYAVRTLAGAFGAVDEASSLLKPIFERGPQWRELLHRETLPDKARPLLDRFPRSGA
ncbi:MAG: DUF1028 domain-containing protein [Chloroflexi bacterium]|nr:DUF1028 domain-containing protein [Chloroflexota bacterium]